jgi:hypothetical protein
MLYFTCKKEKEREDKQMTILQIIGFIAWVVINTIITDFSREGETKILTNTETLLMWIISGLFLAILTA